MMIQCPAWLVLKAGRKGIGSEGSTSSGALFFPALSHVRMLHAPELSPPRLLTSRRELAGPVPRFAFVWDRHQDAVVLQWVQAQDTCAFLRRTWLPEDVR